MSRKKNPEAEADSQQKPEANKESTDMAQTKAQASKKKRAPARKRTPKKSPAKKTQENGQRTFPIVGIGASAGGLDAFEKFFAKIPADSGMAFVLVQHLSAPHKSILAELVQRQTSMKVCQVTDKIKVQPNCVYIIPPNSDLALLHGGLHLMEPDESRGLRLPIDYFFRSLAQDQHERAICIVLSGTGSDGTLGLKAIKGEGGMVMAQEPSSAKYDGMPLSAIQTNLVDYVLAPEKNARAINRLYLAHLCSDNQSSQRMGPRKQSHLAKDFHLAARSNRARFFVLQTKYHPAPHRKTHGCQPDRETGKLCPVSTEKPLGSRNPI